jgi:hypothetical protein
MRANAIAPALINGVAGAALVEHALACIRILREGRGGQGEAGQNGGGQDKVTHQSQLPLNLDNARWPRASRAIEFRHDANGRPWQTRKPRIASGGPHFWAFTFLQ